MNVEKKLKQIADEHFTGWSWMFDDWRSVDRKLAKVEKPVIVCPIPVGGEMTFRNGRVWVSMDVSLCFLDIVPRDANGEDNAAVYERLMMEAARFVGAINKSGLFEPIDGGVRFDTIIEGTANIMTGVLMSLTIRETEGLCL